MAHSAPAADTTALTYLDGDWLEGNPPLLNALSLAAWLSSMVFDGARAFNGLAPDLDRHCQRVVDSAKVFGLAPFLDGPAIEKIAWEGIGKFPKEAELYIRPMYWADDGFVQPDPESTRFAMVISEAPIPEPKGFSATLSPYRRPNPDSAPTDAKASCLYPNSARALQDANARGFQNAVLCDQLGNVAEFATSNLFYVKNGLVVTPVPNGAFLNGITRQRVIKLLRGDGHEVEERRVRFQDLLDADEIFSTGNHAKVTPVSRIEDRSLQPGPVGMRARELYFEFAAAPPASGAGS